MDAEVIGNLPTTPPSHIADNSPFNNIIKWNASSGWSKLQNASGLACVTSGAVGVNGPVYAMDVEYSKCDNTFQGLWVGGSFTKAGGGSAWSIAHWNGNGFWDVPATPAFSSPADGAVFLPPANVTLTATTANGCSVAGVEFYEGNTLLASFTSDPFTFDWNGAPVGTHAITAIATDSNGKVGVSDTVSFRVDSPPTVSVTSPTSGAVFTSPASITINATAVDTDGTIAKVEFYANGVLIGTDTTSPYSKAWTSVAAGDYSITAKTTDSDGAVTTSAAISIHVN